MKVTPFFADKPKQGQPLSRRGLFAGIARMARALERMRIEGGTVEWFDDVPTIIPPTSEGGDEGGGTRKTLSCTVSGDEVIVSPGWIVHGNEIHEIEETAVPIPQVNEESGWVAVGLRYTGSEFEPFVEYVEGAYPAPANNEFLIVLRGVSVELSDPEDSESDLITRLAPVANWEGDVHIHGAFAP